MTTIGLSDNDFFDENELTSVLAREGLHYYACSPHLNNYVLLDSDDIHSFFAFLESNAIKTVFYSFGYLNEEEYRVDVDSNLEKLAQKEIDDYKTSIEKFDFDKPVVLSLFCVYNGMSVIFRMESNTPESILTAKEFHDKIKETYGEELQKLFEAEKEKMIALRDEFRDALLADPDFLACTNKSMRRRFMKTYFVHHGKYLRAFMTADGKIDDGQITIFFDQAYAYYRETKKRQ